MRNKEGAVVTSSGGASFLGLLTLVFIALKLTGSIGWSWWWVLSPIWISWGVTLFVVALFFVIVSTFPDKFK